MIKALLLATALTVGVSAIASDAEAASRKKGKYTEAQLKEIRKRAMEACRKRFGAGVVLRATFDERKNRYVCYTN